MATLPIPSVAFCRALAPVARALSTATAAETCFVDGGTSFVYMGEPQSRSGQHPATFALEGRHGVAQAAPLRFESPIIMDAEREVVEVRKCSYKYLLRCKSFGAQKFNEEIRMWKVLFDIQI